MKIYQLLILCAVYCFRSLAAAGQPVLTRTNTLPEADVQYLETPVLVSGISPGSAGMGAVWDYSGMGANFYDTSSFVDCSTVSHCSDYPGANLVKQYGQSHYVMPDFEFYRVSDDKLELFGTYFFSGEIAPYANAFTVLSYPLSYGGSFVDSFSYVESSSTVIGADTVLADAYGTLLLPSGSYANVLRLKRRIVENIVLGYTSPDGSIQDVYIDSYEWWSADLKARLLQISYRKAIANTTHYDTSIRYYVGAVPNKIVNVEEATASTIFPNPATSQVIVSSLVSSGVVRFRDMLGHVVLERILSGTRTAIDVANLPRGLYITTINDVHPQLLVLD